MENLEPAPILIQKIRERTFGLGVFIYEKDLEPKDLHYLTQLELRMLRQRTLRSDLLEKVALLLTSDPSPEEE